MWDTHFWGDLASFTGFGFVCLLVCFLLCPCDVWDPHQQTMLSTASKVHRGYYVQTGPLWAAGGAPCSHRSLLCPANRCCTDFGAPEEGPASGRQCLWDCGSLWEFPRREEEGPSWLWEFCLRAQLPPICTSPPRAWDLTQLKPGICHGAPQRWPTFAEGRGSLSSLNRR